MDFLNVWAFVFVGVLIVAAIGVLIGGYYSRHALIRRELREKQRVDLGAVVDGATVKVAGTVSCAEGEEPLRAPLSGRPCVAWEVVVEEAESAGESSTWKEVIREQRAQRFVLVDGTGRAIVEPTRPKLALHQDGRFFSGTFNDASPELEAFLDRHGLTSTGFFGLNKQIRYHEGVIEAGETVSAWGRARVEPDPDGGGYRSAATRVVIVDPLQSEMLLSDDESTTW